MRRFNRGLKGALGSIAGSIGLYRSQLRSKFVATAFHRVSASIPEDGLTCDPRKFDAFCRFFKRHFKVVSFRDQILALRSGRCLGGSVSITFDDGYLDNHDVAAPILRSHGLPATFFIATDFIGSNTVPFWDQGLTQPQPWMNWSHVKSLSDQGFEIGCHTASHLNLATSKLATVEEELTRSRQALELHTGHLVDLFAYPFGQADQISVHSQRLVVEKGFLCCASCHGGVNDDRTDPFEVRRIGIAEWFASPEQFGAELLLGKL